MEMNRENNSEHLRAFDLEVLNNFFTFVEKNVMSDNILPQHVFDTKAGHTIDCTFSVTSRSVCAYNP